MAASTSDRNTKRRDGLALSLPMAASTTIHAGVIVCVNSSGVAVNGTTATGLKAVGVSAKRAVSGSVAGADRVEVLKGVFPFGNSTSSDAITLADVGADCYIVDNQTVAKTSATSTRSVAGKVFDVDADGVWVQFL